MSGLDRLLVAAVHALPRKALSRSARRLAAQRSKMAVRQFAARFDVNLDEAEKNLEDYESVLELFTRRLRPGARPIDGRPGVLVSPVDGRSAGHGLVADGTLVQAKGRTYTLDALLAKPGAAARFTAGIYCTLYLAPGDYHRVHSPVDGEIVGYTHVPGDLFSVNLASARHVDGLYARNERVITTIRSPRFGRVDVVKIGATNVGRIRLTYAPQVTTNRGQHAVRSETLPSPIPVARGDEIGVFEIGSTVIVVTEQPVDFLARDAGFPVRVGVALGRHHADSIHAQSEGS